MRVVPKQHSLCANRWRSPLVLEDIFTFEKTTIAEKKAPLFPPPAPPEGRRKRRQLSSSPRCCFLARSPAPSSPGTLSARAVEGDGPSTFAFLPAAPAPLSSNR